MKRACRGLQGEGASRGLEGLEKGFKGASRELEKGFKGVEKGFKGAFKGASSSHLRAFREGTLQASPLKGTFEGGVVARIQPGLQDGIFSVGALPFSGSAQSCSRTSRRSVSDTRVPRRLQDGLKETGRGLEGSLKRA